MQDCLDSWHSWPACLMPHCCFPQHSRMHFGTKSAMCAFRLHDIEQRGQTCDLYVQAGPLTDDELHAAMIRPLRHGARLHALIDACQSCPSLNLRCTARPRRDGWSEWQVCSAQSYFDYNIMHDDMPSGWFYRSKQDITFNYAAWENVVLLQCMLKLMLY